MKQHRFFLSHAIVFGLLFMMAACSQMTPAPRVSTSSTVIRSTPTSPPTLGSTATPPPLGTAPPNCAPGPAVRSIFPELGPGIGTAPLFVFGVEGDSRPLRIPPYDTYVSPYGWTWKIIWEVGPHFSSKITLQGENVHTGAPIWFQLLDEPIVSSAVLDPQSPDHPVPAAGEGYAEWGSYIFIPAAGCYQIEATWPGGQWSFPFAAGRQ
jgi:hypothetical protein